MDLATRIKNNYELRQRPMLTRRMPVIIRVDGKAFHTYTKDMARPFDAELRWALLRAGLDAAQRMQGCKAVYLQSDELSFLLTDYTDFVTDAWFDNNQQKLCSVAASMVTAYFNRIMCYDEPQRPPACFDARAFNIPREEVVNYFLWRMLDWERNSVMMLARAHFSHMALMNKHIPEVHEMLHTKDVNWVKIPDWQRNGSWLLPDAECGWRPRCDITPKYEELSKLLSVHIYPPIQEQTDEHTGNSGGLTDTAQSGTASGAEVGAPL